MALLVQLAPFIGLVGLLWYVVAAWMDDQKLLAFAAVLLAGIGVATALDKLSGDLATYARVASGLCGLLLLCGAIFHWRKLLLPWLLIIGANVLLFSSGKPMPWMKDTGSHPQGVHERR